MNKQLQEILDALDKNGPMTAVELGEMLKANGSVAKDPRRNAQSLIHQCDEIMNVGGNPNKYARIKAKGPVMALKNSIQVKGTILDDMGSLSTFCRELTKALKTCGSEADIKSKVVDRVIFSLGYGDEYVHSEKTVGNTKSERPDIVVGTDKKPRFVVEIKRFDKDLERSVPQLERYFDHMKPPAPVGILTNGLEWKFYRRTLRRNTFIALPFAESSIEKPDGDFLKALSMLSAWKFSGHEIDKVTKKMSDTLSARKTELAAIADFDVRVSEFCTSITCIEHAKWKKDDFKEAAAVAVAAVRKWAASRKNRT